VVALVAAGGLLAGLALGSAPGARTAATRALASLPAPLRPDAGLLNGPGLPGAVLPGSPEPGTGASLPGPALPDPGPAAPTRAPSLPPLSTAPRPTAAPTIGLPSSTGAPSSAPAGDTPPPCAPTARACVDLSANRSWLMRGGRVAYGPVPITHGRPGFRTPPGTFQVATKRRDHVSSIYDAEMPWSVFFNGGIAFHEGSLTVTSHGCIHLSPEAAETFFSDLSVGDVVQVVP
jgi:lipoprotein-anchoring transpeptidase ErfK/SrfK